MNTQGEQAYLDLMKEILEKGEDRGGRNGMTRSLFARQLRFNMEDGFPAITTKKLVFQAVKSELLWFLKMGSLSVRANDNDLKKINGTEKTIWTDNAESPYWAPKVEFPGDLGRIYGLQWRRWLTPFTMMDGRTIDQIGMAIETLRIDPYSRRIVVTAWNPGEVQDMALPPCHMIFQFYAKPNPETPHEAGTQKLSLHMVQRSCDMFLGVPFNIASYALLLAMVANVVKMVPDELVITLNDAHIYHEHFDAVKEQLTRTPKKLPDLALIDRPEIDDFVMDDISLLNYVSDPAIKAKMIV